MAAVRKFLSFETVSLVAAFAILASAGIVTMRTAEHRRISGANLRHTLRVESALHRLYGEIRRAESDERGYLITREPAYLDPRGDLRERLEKDVAQITALVADNPIQSERVEKLRPILQERVELLLRKLEIMNAGRFDEAVALLRDGRGKALMDQIDALIAEMISEEEKIYRERDERLTEATESLQAAIGALMFIGATVAVFVIALAQKQMNALTESRDSLRRAYNQLIEETTRRESLEAQLRQSQKLEALGQLTGGIAHDFNNMLAVIVASLNILRRKLERKESGVEELIDSALDGTERAGNLVHRLLAFARMQPLNPEPLDANEFVSGISEILQRALGGSVRLETALATDLWPTKVDANELENAILNLAVNARDAMPDGGSLTIETSNVHIDDAYAAQNPDARAGHYVMVAVADTGQGMPPDVAAKAFDPFFTTKPVGKGTGLGLSQVHGFVRQSGGHVTISSEAGRGTRVTLYLPRHVDGADAPQPEPEAKLEDFPRGKPAEIILVVEDDDSARRATSQGVRELGYTVLEANDGKEALQIIRKRADISLMIAEAATPGLDGGQLAREAVFRRHALQLLFVTGSSPDAITRDAVFDAKVSVLTKPFTLAQLARKIRETLDGPANLTFGRT